MGLNIITVVVFGLLVGSFLNVCIYRIPKKESVVFPSSHCTGCGQKLSRRELVPIFSFIFLKGKCRHCRGKISFRYPLVEVTNGVLWGLFYLHFGMGWCFVLGAALSSFLLVLSFIDMDTYTLPDGILLTMLALIPIAFLCEPTMDGMVSRLIGAVAISLPLFFIAWITKGGIGGGDIKLMAVCGLLIGARLIVFAFFAGAFLAAVISVFLLWTKRKKRKEMIPLGPFLSLGVVLSLFCGNFFIAWYLSFF